VLVEFDHLLTPDGWVSPAWIEIDGAGAIAAVRAERPQAPADERIKGHAIPGMANVHSHAFQRAMAGLAEHGGPAEDNFWSWREVMYRFLARLTPDDVEAIAAQLYVEMVKAGYTAVGEFHYLHHDRDGRPYADRAELARRIVAAARTAGIGLTLLPSLYAAGGFGGALPTQGQRRFVADADDILALIQTLASEHAQDPQVRLGAAPHSLRAVPPGALRQLIDGLEAIDAAAPIHIHAAEQTKEVEECVAWSNARPVEWLLANCAVGERWCVVHATHMAAPEVNALAASGAAAGLCPTTEGNLGDGLFALPAYLAANGRFAIGSDSHVSVSPIEELRWLEYGQRLSARRRNVIAAKGQSSGALLYRSALAGGAQAMARPIGAIAPGRRADIVVLDADHPSLGGRSGDGVLDAYVFSGNVSPVRSVMVGGNWVVRDGRHAKEAEVAERYRRVVARLAA
jgi:formimidoylglutamate deiminase